MKLYDLARQPARHLLDAMPDSWQRQARVGWGKLRARAGLAANLVDEDALCELFGRGLDRLLDASNGGSIGDYLEFGVYSGSSMICMHECLAARRIETVRLFGFDSFEGLPPDVSDEDEGVWRPGQFATSEPATRQRLRAAGIAEDRLFLVKGWFEESLTEALVQRHAMHRAGVIMVDCDNYGSARTALAFAAPLIGRYTLIVFDDYTAFDLDRRDAGEKRAFDEFLAAHPDLHVTPFAAYPPHGRAFWIERRH